MPNRIQPVPPEKLRWICAPGTFSFKTTEELHVLEGTIGQDRALKAMDFGLGLSSHGFNIYVLGESGTGKTTTIKNLLEKKAKGEKVPDDWCYVYNFVDPDRPFVLSLPSGMGVKLKSDMEELVGALRRDIPKVFESKDYERHRDEILDGQQERTKTLFYRLEQKAQEKGFVLKKTAGGLLVVPAKEGKPMKQEDFETLPKHEKQRIEVDSKFMQDKLADTIREARTIEKETKDRINNLDREVVQYVVNPLISELLEKYKKFDHVVKYLECVKEDVLEHSDDFRPKEEFPIALPGIKLPKAEPSFERYAVNLIVNNKDRKGAPVVVETNPTYYNLFGRLEYRVQYGIASTDFTMIKAGSIHRANGGYLVVNALDLLRNIFSYDSLKRAVKNKEVRIEDVWEQYRLVSTASLKPEAIPLNIKIILIGSPFLYYLLYNLDDEYKKFFKVKADFDSKMPRNKENLDKYALFIATRCREEGLKPFDRTGVAKIVEYGCRLADEQEKLSARFSEITDIIREASFWAERAGNKSVTGIDVEKALDEKVYRNNRIEERIRELIVEGTLMVDTDGAAVGQVNGIAVIGMGDYAFGKPAKITAKTYMGEAGVVNIEREAKMSGKIHNKGMMILTGYLGEKYGQETPITLSASICFEQSYEEVEGDSAASTELYALLSSLSGVPIQQGIAVTGSINQMGEVQPIGGVNEKVEGFFDVCAVKGLTGKQGVLIPAKNLKHLMLKTEVIDAVKQGKFNIYAVENVEQGIEVLTGVEVGARMPDGSYPEGTINCLVSKRLKELAKNLKEFGKEKKKEKEAQKENKK
ncbi:MAG: ATP-dependent protease [Deltaproteobacteria bacterium GWC2_42_11]|nr:MAG: ATP-dependent protease [Deltaproteobacteria bacterium GWC2_42_11]